MVGPWKKYRTPFPGAPAFHQTRGCAHHGTGCTAKEYASEVNILRTRLSSCQHESMDKNQPFWPFVSHTPECPKKKKHHWISLEESLKGGNHVFCSIHCVDFRFELSRKIRWKHDDKGTPWQVTKSSNLIASRTSMAGARRCSWQVVVSFKWGVSEWVTPKIDSLDWNILFKWVIWIDLGAPPFEETSKWDVTYKKIND